VSKPGLYHLRQAASAELRLELPPQEEEDLYAEASWSPARWDNRPARTPPRSRRSRSSLSPVRADGVPHSFQVTCIKLERQVMVEPPLLGQPVDRPHAAAAAFAQQPLLASSTDWTWRNFKED